MVYWYCWRDPPERENAHSVTRAGSCMYSVCIGVLSYGVRGDGGNGLRLG
jgi:hypothetical protein